MERFCMLLYQIIVFQSMVGLLRHYGHLLYMRTESPFKIESNSLQTSMPESGYESDTFCVI